MEEFYNNGKVSISAVSFEEYDSYIAKMSELQLPEQTYICYTQIEGARLYKKAFLEEDLAKQWVKEEELAMEQRWNSFDHERYEYLKRYKYLNEIPDDRLTTKQDKELEELEDVFYDLERESINTFFGYITVPLGG